MKIYKDYFPCGIESGIESTPVKHAIFVQCLNGSQKEAEWVMDMATRHPVIKGVVAGLDLTSPNVNTRSYHKYAWREHSCNKVSHKYTKKLKLATNKDQIRTNTVTPTTIRFFFNLTYKVLLNMINC